VAGNRNGNGGWLAGWFIISTAATPDDNQRQTEQNRYNQSGLADSHKARRSQNTETQRRGHATWKS